MYFLSLQIDSSRKKNPKNNYSTLPASSRPADNNLSPESDLKKKHGRRRRTFFIHMSVFIVDCKSINFSVSRSFFIFIFKYKKILTELVVFFLIFIIKLTLLYIDI